MREKYESLSVTVLRDVAKSRGLKHLSGLKKRELVDLMLKEDEKEANAQKEAGADIGKEEKEAERAEERKLTEKEESKEAGKIEEQKEQTEEKKEQAEEEKTDGRTSFQRDNRNDRLERNPRADRKTAKILQMVLRLIIRNLTAASARMEFLKSCRMVMDLSDVKIICQGNMTFMYPPLRSASSVLRPGTLSMETQGLRRSRRNSALYCISAASMAVILPRSCAALILRI